MRVLVLHDYHEDFATAVRSLRVEERPVPQPRRGEVLVRIEAAPCNPSDEIFLTGRYAARKTLPAVPGWEGAGTVVASGGGWYAGWLQGQRVACGSQADRDGTWAEYCAIDAMQCVPLRPKVPIEQGASLLINPLTTLAMFDIAQRHHAAAVQTAAASQLGRMLIRLAERERYPLVNIVRRDEQVDLLRGEGAEHVLNSESPQFFDELRGLCHRLRATIAFDAVAGPMTGALVAALPPRSKVLVYGALAGESCGGISPVDLLFDQKHVEGFYLVHWVKEAGKLRVLLTARRAQRLIEEGVFRSEIWRRVGLDDAPRAILEHRGQATLGKVLITPVGA